MEVFITLFWRFKLMCKKVVTNFSSSWKSDESLWTNSDNSVFATGCNYFSQWANMELNQGRWETILLTILLLFCTGGMDRVPPPLAKNYSPPPHQNFVPSIKDSFPPQPTKFNISIENIFLRVVSWHQKMLPLSSVI